MQKNFDGIDIFFIVIISIYFLTLIVFVTIILRKYLKDKENKLKKEIALEQTIKADKLKEEIEKKLTDAKKEPVRKKRVKKSSTKNNTKKKSKSSIKTKSKNPSKNKKKTKKNNSKKTTKKKH